MPRRQLIQDENGTVISRSESFYDDETSSGNNPGSVTVGNLTLRRDWITPSNSLAFVNAARTKYDVYGNPIRYVDPTGFGELGYGEEGLTPDYGKIGEYLKEDVKNVDWGRVGQVAGGAGSAASGVALCATVVGCVVGAPLVAYGSDQMVAGAMGEQTLTEKYLGKDFSRGMDLISFAAGGATLAASIANRSVSVATTTYDRPCLGLVCQVGD